MWQEKLDRINELARKSRAAELSQEEKDEQKRLREEYIQIYRGNLASILDSIRIVDKDGNKRKLSKNQDQS
ncbi:MAG: DUF896 domain-containing protein [Eubacteriaceae bacterium]|nr:DUF896 domain-containing protein [Eubacteriaceae bacterium]